MNQKIPTILQNIVEKKPVGIEKSNILLGKFLHSIMYPNASKLNDKDTNFWATESCNGCQLCAKICPFENIKMSDGRPKWQHHCQMCMRCIHICPKRSIQYGKKTLKKGRYLNPEITTADLTADGKDSE